ncbi:MAG: AraC family transcriptional regulator, partial [Bacteroidaceae bacterium]|nr:AraC family transcriptional regulator [Bacteroidaceae bacterium]
MTTLPFQHLSLTDIEEKFRTSGALSSVIDACGFFLCQRGWAKILVGKHTYELHPGDVFIYTPATYVSLLERSDEVAGMAVRSTLDIIVPFAERSISATDLMMLRERPCFSLTPEQQRNIEEMMSLIEKKEARWNKQESDAVGLPILRQQLFTLTDTFFQELLYAYFVNQGISPVPQDGKGRIFQNFMLSLMRNYKKEREVLFYANEQHLSPRYFSTVVREQSGHTASEWIVNIVISNTSQLLAHTNRSIKSIAAEYNFANQSFFGKYFKQATGMSPKLYRKTKGDIGDGQD